MGETDIPDTEQAPADEDNQVTFGRLVFRWALAVGTTVFMIYVGSVLAILAVHGVIGLFDSLLMQVLIGAATAIIVAVAYGALIFVLGMRAIKALANED